MDAMVVYLKAYRLKEVQNEYAYKLLVKDFLEQEEILDNTFSKVEIAIAAPEYTLVPSRYLDENALEDYLNFNHNVPAGSEIYAERFGGGVVNNIVYAVDRYLLNAIEARFKKFSLQHALTQLVNGLIREHKSNDNGMYVNVQRGYIDLVVLHGSQMQLCNSYAYQTPEDLLYYVLNAAQHSNLSTHKDSFVFSGDINQDTAEYQLAQRYLENIGLSKRPTNRLFTPELDVLEKQYHRALFSIGE